MSMCAVCAVIITGDGEICNYHHHGDDDSWATGNRAMCDFLHRKRIPPSDDEDARAELAPVAVSTELVEAY